jgi:class 3 adenylate cyclase
MHAAPASTTVERILDAFDSAIQVTAREYGGTVRFIMGDSCCVTFKQAETAMAGAECLTRNWEVARRREQFGCTISSGVHRGTFFVYRSFLYGRDVDIVSQLQGVSARLLTSDENGIFVSDVVRTALVDAHWQNRLQLVRLPSVRAPLAAIDVYRLCDAAPIAP